jgi:hypothetical protein
MRCGEDEVRLDSNGRTLNRDFAQCFIIDRITLGSWMHIADLDSQDY